MKKLLSIIAGFVILLGGLFVALGLYIPNERTFTQVTEINAPPETVWKVLNDREKYPEWQNQLEKIEIVNEKEWVEYTPGGKILFRLDAAEVPRSMDISYTMVDPFRGSWRGELSGRGDATLLRTTDSTVVNGWLTKIMMYFFFDLEDFATDWNKRLKSEAEKR